MADRRGYFTTQTAREAQMRRWAKDPGAAERTERRIQQLVIQAPPLTEDQKAKLRALLAAQDEAPSGGGSDAA